MVLLFDGELVEHRVKPFIEDMQSILNRCGDSDEDFKLDIFFSSDGGVAHYSRILAEVFNRNSDKIRIFLFGGIASAAFDLFFLLEDVEVYITPTFIYGMAHQGEWSVDVNSNLSDIAIEWNKRHNNFWNIIYKSGGISAAELKLIKKGADVYFDRDRMFEIFPNFKEWHR